MGILGKIEGAVGGAIHGATAPLKDGADAFKALLHGDLKGAGHDIAKAVEDSVGGPGLRVAKGAFEGVQGSAKSESDM